MGGVLYLAKLAGSVPTSANFEYYAQIVLEQSILRRLIAASSEIATACIQHRKPSAEIINSAISKLSVIGESALVKRETPEELDDLAAQAIFRLERLADNNGILGLKTGLNGYDRLTGGLEAGMHVIGARTSGGKTAISLNITLNVAKSGKKVLFLTLEMSKLALVQRLIMLEGGIDNRRLREGFLGRAEKAKIRPAACEVANLSVEIAKGNSFTPSAIRRFIQGHRDVDLVIIDYLQLMSSDTRANSRQEEVARISREIKILSGEFNLPIIVLSQLSREAENGAPKLSHLKESGAIEQDADTVLMLSPDEKTGNVIASLSKGRDCGTGIFEIHYNRNTQKMGDVGRADAAAPAPPMEDTYNDGEEPW
jgi:replicative DNA helicase